MPFQESAVVGRQRKAAMFLRQFGATCSFSGSAGWLLKFNKRKGFFIDPCSIDIALALGIDLRPVTVNSNMPVMFRTNEGKFHTSRVFGGHFGEIPLLEMAIMCGQDDVAERLASVGCDASGITWAGLHGNYRGRPDLDDSDSNPWDDDHDYPAYFAAVADRLKTARLVHRRISGKYRLPIWQLARWWQRAYSDYGDATITMQHTRIVEYIEQYANQILVLPEFV